MYEITPQNEFLVGIDSDGCVFDTMELKHKECFIPRTIYHYNLQGISKYAREAAEFVNLYSKDRGINRFPALIKTLEWLQQRPEVTARNVNIEVPEPLRIFVREETKLGNPALEARVKATGDPDLRRALTWSTDVNEGIASMVRGVRPFPQVRECLEKLGSTADMLVVSATPNEALTAEWEEHGVAQHVAAICGQESGTKKETLGNATKYAPHKTLMIGDAPGDQRAALANHCLFFPINPGEEELSWQRFYTEGIDKFLNGQFTGPYQQSLLDEFDRKLPEIPPWQVKS